MLWPWSSTFIGSLTYFIKPALSPFMAMLFLHEAITGRILLGVALLLTGAASPGLMAHAFA